MYVYFGKYVVPIRFFPYSVFIEFFPPIEASTIHSNDVGMNIKDMPRIYMLDKKPPKSVTTPPSMHMIKSFLSKLFLNIKFKALLRLSYDLDYSPG